MIEVEIKNALSSFTYNTTSNKQVPQRYCLELMIIAENIINAEEKNLLLLGEI
ncbi:MAG TPA: hypothetical protein VK431_05120 [Nitrosopumilaceae archaeon]|nr:hypothetical protein [Nitrosopumilaceae archaeon]